MPKLGRPPKPEAERRNRVLQLRLTQADATRLERASRRLGLPIAEILRKGGKMFIERNDERKGATRMTTKKKAASKKKGVKKRTKKGGANR